MNDYIMVVDLESSEKALPIARRFLNLASRVFYIQHTDKVREIKKNGNDSDYTTILPEFRLIFLHNKYKNVLPKEAKYRCLINYSGGEGHFSKKNAHWEYWLNRKINNENDMPSETETRQLLEWAIECKEEDMPAILLPPQGASGLIALSILCQGYLAVHAEYAGPAKDWKDEELRPALEQMGWYALKEGSNLTLVPNNLGNKIGAVRKADWWLGVFDVFDEKDEQKKQIVEKKWDAFEKGLKTEWNESENGKVSNKLCELIALLHKQENVNQPDCVANAYCAIIKRLEKEPCNT